jgi:hypothetical protein
MMRIETARAAARFWKNTPPAQGRRKTRWPWPWSIMTDLVEPAWTRGRLVGRRWLARFDEAERATHHVVKALGDGG